MINRYPLLYRLLWAGAAVLVLLAWLAPEVITRLEFPMALALILFIGLPHGATDHLLFRQLMREKGRPHSLPRFYAAYLGLIAFYGFLWWVLPTVALAIFLLISVYHFGQSNWNYLDARAWLMHLSWGAFVLFVPIIWHYPDSKPVMESMIRQGMPDIPASWRTAIVLTLWCLNQGLILWKTWAKKLTHQEGLKESVNLGVLFLLFLYTPLLLGFAVYFAGWHALSSSMDQIGFFQKNRRSYRWKDYVREALPYTLMALVGLAAFFMLFQYQAGFAQMGLVFMFIAAVTLPHMLLIDQLYEQSS